MLFGVLFSTTIAAQSQTLAEWTQQRRTQIRYLLQQVVALQAYTSQLQQGYQVLQKGLSTISRITDGEYKLHELAFGALKRVNPAIRAFAQVPEMIARQWKMVQRARRAVKEQHASGQFTEDELGYIERVLDKLIEGSVRQLDELLTLTTASEYELEDSERMDRILAAQTELNSLYGLVHRFAQSNLTVSAQRTREATEVHHSRALYQQNGQK